MKAVIKLNTKDKQVIVISDSEEDQEPITKRSRTDVEQPIDEDKSQPAGGDQKQTTEEEIDQAISDEDDEIEDDEDILDVYDILVWNPLPSEPSIWYMSQRPTRTHLSSCHKGLCSPVQVIRKQYSDRGQQREECDLDPCRSIFTLWLDTHLDPVFQALRVVRVRPNEHLSVFVHRPGTVRRLDVKGAMGKGSFPCLNESRREEYGRLARRYPWMAGQRRTQSRIERTFVLDVHRVGEPESKYGSVRVVAQCERDTGRSERVWALRAGLASISVCRGRDETFPTLTTISSSILAPRSRSSALSAPPCPSSGRSEHRS